ncbi:MAG: 2-dehydro-3-deoxygalactonokinase [Bdellovibrionota bacterium]
MAVSNHIIAIDWGTSSFRAFLFDPQLSIVSEIQSDKGVKKLSQEQQKVYLESQLRLWKVDHPHAKIYLCGMVGSTLGFCQAPYVDTPFDIRKLIQNLVKVNDQTFIIPGLKTPSQTLGIDVIRGEETLILGCLENDGDYKICLPGTHSKWVEVHERKVHSFSTSMTGEIFDIISSHSILCSGNQIDSHDDFQLGLQDAYKENLFLHSLFKTRTRVLENADKASTSKSYLSGLMIGSEIYHYAKPEDQIILCCNETLAARYRMAFQFVGCKATWIPSTKAFLKGIRWIDELATEGK